MKNMTKFGLLPVAALATVTAGTLMTADSAEAAALTGDFSLNGVFTTITLSQNQLSFDGANLIGVSSNDGDSFDVFHNSAAIIQGPVTLNPFSAIDPFITFNDGSIFNLTGASISVDDVASGAAEITLDILGTFISSTNDETKGKGVFTFQTETESATEVLSILENGGDPLSGLTFSGSAFTTAVPEPATMLGLGLVAGAGFLASRRKQAEA